MGLIGPNGAGKTTLLNVVGGLLKADSGDVILDGKRITNRPAHELFHMGLARTFQVPREFKTLSVLENLLVVPPNQLGERLSPLLCRYGQVVRQEKRWREQAGEVLARFELLGAAKKGAQLLSAGQKKLLEFARFQMADCVVMLLDEPAAGVQPAFRERIAEHIKASAREMRVGVLLIEHDLNFVKKVCDRVYVMVDGRIVAELADLEEVGDVSWLSRVYVRQGSGAEGGGTVADAAENANAGMHPGGLGEDGGRGREVAGLQGSGRSGSGV